VLFASWTAGFELRRWSNPSHLKSSRNIGSLSIVLEVFGRSILDHAGSSVGAKMDVGRELRSADSMLARCKSSVSKERSREVILKPVEIER